MDDTEMPTTILKSLRDLNKFLKVNSEPLTNGTTSPSPRQKLDFSDSTVDLLNDTSVNDDGEDDIESFASSDFIKKHQENIAGLAITKNIREKESELLLAKAEISTLESKVQNFESLFKKTRLDHEREIDNLRSERNKDKEQIREISSKLHNLQRNETDVKEKLQVSNKQLRESSAEWKDKYIALYKSTTEKNNRLSEEVSTLREKVSTLENSLSKTTRSFKELQLENQDLAESNEKLRSRTAEGHQLRMEIESLQLKLSQTENKNNELEVRLHELKDRDDHKHMFDNAINRIPALQEEINKLKEENHLFRLTRVNTELLEEKLQSTEEHIKVMENRCNELTSENATLLALRELMEEYEVAVKKEFEVDYLPPIEEFVLMLRSLKQKDQVVNDSISELKASLESHKTTQEQQDILTKELTEKLAKTEEELGKSSHIVQRLQRKLILLAKERDNLKDIIASYESESTVMPSALEQEKISLLEAQLQDYKVEISKLEQELESFQTSDGQRVSPRVSSISQSQDSAKLQKEVEDLKVQILRLTEDKDLLEEKLEQHGYQGGFDPGKTKILNFQDNPLEKAHQERSKQLESLSLENESLKMRIKLLEEGEKEDLTVKVGMKVDDSSSLRVKELEEKMNSLEKRNGLMIESFKEKSQEMREIVFRLLGYRVDLMGKKNYRLTNIFSDSKEDFLLFEQTNEGDLQLLETDFSDTLESLIETYLHQDDSYPLFLSALTLDLHKKQASLNDSDSPSEAEEEDQEQERDEEEEEYVGDDVDAEIEEDYHEEYEENDDDDEENEGMLEDEEDESDVERGEEDEEDEDDDGYEEPSSKRARTEIDDDDDDDLICLD